MLSASVWLWSHHMGHLLAANFPKETWLLLPQQLSTVHSAWAQVGASETPPPSILECLTGLIFYRECTGNHSYCKCILLSFHDGNSHIISREQHFPASSLFSSSYNLSMLSSEMFPEPRSGGIYVCVPSRAEHSKSLILCALPSYDSLY